MRLLSVARSSVAYVSTLAARDAPVITAMRELAGQYPRYGYRKIRIFLGRGGHTMSPERTYRLWRHAGLQVPKRRPRRRVATSRPRPLPATGPNQVWAYDFVFDTCADGRTLKCLTIVDEFTRECLAIDVAGGIRSGRVIEVLSRLVSVHGAPRHLRSDNGPEFVATALLRWLAAAQIETAFIDPGKQWLHSVRATGRSASRFQPLMARTLSKSPVNENGNGRHPRRSAARCQTPNSDEFGGLRPKQYIPMVGPYGQNRSTPPPTTCPTGVDTR